ncbi:MAG: hypothetical protein OHK0037_31840 [Elainellaceae cyanobacterium]
MPPGTRLEQYTLKRPGEVLLVTARTVDGEDQVAIFRGFSSSLMRPTAYDPDIPVLPTEAEILSVDRLQGPYDPANPVYLQQGLSWAEMQELLSSLGI